MKSPAPKTLLPSVLIYSRYKCHAKEMAPLPGGHHRAKQPVVAGKKLWESLVL